MVPARVSKLKSETIYYCLFEIFDIVAVFPDTGTGSGTLLDLVTTSCRRPFKMVNERLWRNGHEPVTFTPEP
jgi:hypothetical protein